MTRTVKWHNGVRNMVSIKAADGRIASVYESKMFRATKKEFILLHTLKQEPFDLFVSAMLLYLSGE